VSIQLALAGNPNCGKTTLFNRLTGENGYVGNWPGVTVEKKQAKLSSDKDVVITDLPGIYSLSPYSPEEVVSRDYLVNDRPDVVVNVVDATNIERNLYLTTQLLELGLPVVVALNMCDLVEKNGDTVKAAELAKLFGCPVVEISALRGTGVDQLMATAKKAAAAHVAAAPTVRFGDEVEAALAAIVEACGSALPKSLVRWYSIKLFEGDEAVADTLKLSADQRARVKAASDAAAEKLDDDPESIVTSERYDLIGRVVPQFIVKAPKKVSITERIDRVVTNRWLGIPIFIVVMFLVYFISVSTVGTVATDWANDGVFGDGWFLGAGQDAFDEACEAAADAGLDDPDPADYGVWVPGIPAIVGGWLESAGVADWVYSLVIDGAIAGVGAILGFVPQMIILFMFLCLLEDCGYMARVAFVMDRVFRRFGLSGKSFIPILISSGCGVPGVMSTKTIENEAERRMTVMTTTFVPCGAKMPIIALLMGALLGDTESWWIAPLFYFMGVVAVIVSGIMLKKTRIFAGDASPFIMELPAYHLPALRSYVLHVWERVKSFIMKAGTIIFAASVLVWFLSSFGWVDGAFGMLDAEADGFMDDSILAAIGGFIGIIFAPLGFDSWQASSMTITGLIAKENVVATLGTIYSMGDLGEADAGMWAAFASMVSSNGALIAYGAFNLLCAPCFAAMGAIRKQMDGGKWFWIAIGYECLFAWCVALMINQFYNWFALGQFGVWTVVAVAVLLLMLFQLFRPMPKRADA
jgi:ferrous iron transport protein B